MKSSTTAVLGISVILLSVMHSFIPTRRAASMKKQYPTDHHATHNMLVVGENTVYLSHLPMFQEVDAPPMPHRYQAIVEVAFHQQGSDPQNAYKKDRQGHSNITVYTINPAPFVLPALVSSGQQDEPLRSFSGSLFRGHLEKGGKRILMNIGVTVKQVVYFQKFDSLAKRPSQLEYLLFGRGSELFLAHLITAPPDFDQVLSVKIADHSLSEAELAKGIKVVFPGTKNSPLLRLNQKQLAVGELRPGDNSAPRKVKVSTIRELYFEEGELRTPPTFESTQEEKKVGFM